MADLSEIVSFIVALVPFLNAGLVILIIDLILRRLGLEISKGDFNRSPLSSLGLGLGLILVSNFAYLLVQGLLSQVSPLGLSLILILIYFATVFSMTPKKHRKLSSRRRHWDIVRKRLDNSLKLSENKLFVPLSEIMQLVQV